MRRTNEGVVDEVFLRVGRLAVDRHVEQVVEEVACTALSSFPGKGITRGEEEDVLCRGSLVVVEFSSEARVNEKTEEVLIDEEGRPGKTSDGGEEGVSGGDDADGEDPSLVVAPRGTHMLEDAHGLQVEKTETAADQREEQQTVNNNKSRWSTSQ